MSNLVISLRRLSIEEIEIATGRKFKEEPKKKTNSRNTQGTKKLVTKDNLANSKKKSDKDLSRSEKSSNSETKIHTRKSNQYLANSNEKTNTKLSVKNKFTHSHQSTNLATAGNKRRIEITDSEKNLKPNPKRQKFETNQYATDLVPERVTRSKTRGQKAAETQPNEMKSNEINKYKETHAKNEVSKGNIASGSESSKVSNLKKSDGISNQIAKTRGQKAAETRRNEMKSNEINKNKTSHAKEEVSKGNIASGSESSKVSNSKKSDEISNQVAVLDFRVGEVVWAKIRGFPGWPARIEQINGDKRQTFRVHWFNDYRTSTIFKSQVFKFYSNFDQYSQQFQSHIGLETAAREALLYLAQTEKK